MPLKESSTFLKPAVTSVIKRLNYFIYPLWLLEASSTAISTQTLKFVKVECPAFATVEFNTATSENLTVFGSGTSINVFPDGYYILHHSKGGRVEVSKTLFYSCFITFLFY